MENQQQKDDSANSKVERQSCTRSIWTQKSLLRRLARNPESRAKFVESQISNGIASQIRALRNREKWSQPKLAEKIGTTQNQIYRLEKATTTKPTISSLRRIAAAFDVALVVRFVPFSQMIAWVSGTPFTDPGLSTASLYVPSFRQEYETVETVELGKMPGIEGNEAAQGKEIQEDGPGCSPFGRERGLLANAAD